jgi:hypothetical protein
MTDLTFDLLGEPPTQVQINAYARWAAKWEFLTFIFAILTAVFAFTSVVPVENVVDLAVYGLSPFSMTRTHVVVAMFFVMCVLGMQALQRHQGLSLLMPVSAQENEQARQIAARDPSVLGVYYVKVQTQQRRLTQIELALIRHIGLGDALPRVKAAH